MGVAKDAVDGDMAGKGNDGVDKLRKRLIFRSWHRGTREMDLIMGRFADAFVPQMTAAELADYARLLEESDPDIYDWLCARADVPEASNTAVLQRLIRHHFPDRHFPDRR
jgi:antitoxin CptB